MIVEHIGNATLYMGDCRDILPTLGSVDVVVTDPPFGIDYQSGRPRTDGFWREDRIQCDESTGARDEALSILAGKPALVFGSWKAPKPSGTRTVLIWDKGPALGMGALDLPWKPTFEEIYVIGSGFVGRRDGAVIYCPPVQSMAKNGRLHPNEKPVRLLRALISRCPPGTVCDPFMGSGSTGVAAAAERRPFVGMEIDPDYFAVARKRIADAQRQGALDLEMTA